jgi:hypothetical protein
MYSPNGLHNHALYFKIGFIVEDRYGLHARHARVFVLGKDVGKLPLQLIEHALFSEHGHIALLLEIVSPDVVHTGRVVLVLVGKKQRIKVIYLLAKHLLTKVGPRVNDNTFAPHSYMR